MRETSWCLILYILMWVVSFGNYYKKVHRIGVAGGLILLYLTYAILSLVLFNDSIYSDDYKDLKLFPFLYLFFLLRFFIVPLENYERAKYTTISNTNIKCINTMAWLVIITSFLSIPRVISEIQTGLMLIVLDSSAGKEMYGLALEKASESGHGAFNIISIISNSFTDLSIFLLFYYLTLKSRNRVIIFGLFISVITVILSSLASGQRTLMVINFITVFCSFLLFKPFLSEKVNKWATKMGVAVMALLSIPFFALTFSRYGDNDNGALSSIIDYAGQANLNFNNYGLDAGGIRYGDRTFNLFKMPFDDTTPRNFIERREKYPRLLMDDEVFSTYVGDFTLDFGPYVAFFIIVLYAIIIIRKTHALRGMIPLRKLLLLYLTMCISAQGGMYLYTYADFGALKMIMIFIFYFLLSISSRKTITAHLVNNKL